MIVNDYNEAISCRLLPRDIGQKTLYFGCLAYPKMYFVILYYYLQQNGMERNGTERNGTEQNGLELKNRPLNFHGTLKTNYLLNLFFYA